MLGIVKKASKQLQRHTGTCHDMTGTEEAHTEQVNQGRLLQQQAGLGKGPRQHRQLLWYTGIRSYLTCLARNTASGNTVTK